MNGMEKIDLKDATDEDVRTFARVFLQLEGADADAIKTVRKNVEAAWPQGFIWKSKPVEPQQIQFQAAPAAPALTKAQIEAKAGAGIAPTSSKNDPIVVLTIAKSDQPGGKEPVYLNVNGNAIHIARGEKQNVPYRFWFDLVQTIQRIWNWDDRKNEMSYEDVLRFALNIHRFPTEDEIFEFMRRDAALSNQDYTREQFEAQKDKLMAA